METSKLKQIKMSMMKQESDINDDSKATYTKKNTAIFTIPIDFYDHLSEKESEELTRGLVNGMYEDLLEQVSYNEIDSIGLWIKYDGKLYENAMNLKVLKEINEYGSEGIDEIYEFFKMTLNEIYYSFDVTSN